MSIEIIENCRNLDIPEHLICDGEVTAFIQEKFEPAERIYKRFKNDDDLNLAEISKEELAEIIEGQLRTSIMNSVSRGSMCESAFDALWVDPDSTTSDSVHRSDYGVAEITYTDITGFSMSVYDKKNDCHIECRVYLRHSPLQCHRPHCDLYFSTDGNPHLDEKGKIQPELLHGIENRRKHLMDLRTELALKFAQCLST